jgi:F-type H+-transporting ATPase subunit alpha
MERSPVSRQLVTGLRALDAMIPIGRGQRELIIGDRMTGKTALALDAMLNQRNQQMVCIYCSVGQSHQKVQHVIQLLQATHAMDYSVVMAAPASCEASEQFLAPYAACAVGESFMHQGRDVLVVFDDLSKHAWAYRQLSLLLERPPGREAYPGDMFYIHSQFMERAGQLSPERGGGSMTFLPICETQQGDVTGYISSNLISMTDGQIYLSSDLFYDGIKPAIDVGLSVSRIGNKVQPHLLRWASESLRLDLVQYQELQRLSRFAGAASEDLAARQRRGALLRHIMCQPAHQPSAMEDQVLLLAAFKNGWLEQLTDEGVAVCRAGLSARIPAFVLEAIRNNQPLTPVLHAKVDTALEDVLRPYRRPEDTRHAVAQATAR